MERFTKVLALTVALAALVAAPRARAHHDPLSSLTVTVETSAVRLSLVAPTDELALWTPPAPSHSPEQYAAALARKLQDEAPRLFELRLDYNVVSPSNVRANAENPQTVGLEIEYPPPDAGTLQSLQVFSNLVTKLSKSHEQVVCVRDARGVPSPGGAPRIVAWLTLTPDRFTAFADLSPTATTRPATVPVFDPSPDAASRAEPVSFFRLGVEHILIGYDHLLFLAALLLVCANFREAATVITSFTVAHSITLALAALDLVRLPSRAVEAVIAASIVYVAMENILGFGKGKQRLTRRAAITFAFGLVHGLGFASVLRELGLGSAPGGVVLPLLKFNLGVETGQLFAAAIAFPIILALRGRGPVMQRSFVPACSVLIALVGTWWLVDRVA